MATRKDMQDMLGLPAEGLPKPAAQKRQRPPAAPGKRLGGINREVLALMGERPPPIAIYDANKAFKSKRHTGPAKKWAQTPFLNPARRDDLVLKHWRRKPAPVTVANDPDTTMEDAEPQVNLPVQTHYEFDKYNISVDVPGYTDEQYAAHLRSNDWSREETDYLFDMVKEYHHRWAAIWDRYDFQPPAPALENGDASSAVALPRKQRTMEDLKSRFYSAQAILMTLKVPENQMTRAEDDLYKTLTKYNPATEENRKAIADKLLARTKEDVLEEQFLLIELQRICASMDRLEAERTEIRSVLDLERPVAPITQYQTSAGLNALFSQLFAQDKSRKRLSTGGSGPPRLSISTSELQTPNGITPPHHRDSLVSAGGASQKKGSMSAGIQQPQKLLSPAAERRFGVTTHDRLQSGVTFRSDKLIKLRQAKSVVQTQKIVAALIELGVPDVVAMPSLKTCEAYEKLVQRVHKLLESRKAREKEEQEMKTGRALVKELQKRLTGLGETVEGYVEEEESLIDADKKADTTEINEDEDADAAGEDEDEDTKMDDDANGDEDAEGSADENDAEHDPENDNDDAEGEEDNDNDPDVDASELREDNESDVSVNADDLSDPGSPSNASEAEPEEDDAAAAEEEEDEDLDADGETETNGITRPSSIGVDDDDEDELAGPPHKRSASVLSQGSSKASKRARR